MEKEKMLLMTPLQCAYMIERKKSADSMGVPCHVYMEFQTKQIEEENLKSAWLELFRVHPIMRARCDDCGCLYISYWEKAQYYKTYREWDIVDFEKGNIREKISHQALDVENGIACRLHVIKSSNAICRIGFELDLVICDVYSFQVILRDLADFYIHMRTGNAILQEPDQEMQLDSNINRKDVLAARKYWKERIGDEYIEFPFKLQKSFLELSQYRYTNLQAEVKTVEYQKIIEMVTYKGVSVEEYLLIVFCYVILKETGKKKILINYPFFERNSHNINMVGDFTQSVIFKCESPINVCFENFFDLMHIAYKEDLSHCCLDGLSVQKIIKETTDEKYPVPLVFSPSVAIPIISKEFIDNIGVLDYIISQTPGVWLDAQVYQKEGGLLLTWVILKDILDWAEITRIFNAYIKAITSFNNIKNWENDNYDK